MNFLFVEKILLFLSEQSLSNNCTVKSEKVLLELHTDRKTNQSPSSGNNCLMTIKYETETKISNNHNKNNNSNNNKNFAFTEAHVIEKNFDLNNEIKNEKEINNINLNNIANNNNNNYIPMIADSPNSRCGSKPQEILMLNNNLNLNLNLNPKAQRNSRLASKRNSNSNTNLNLSELAQLKGFIPSTLVLANKLEIPSLLGGNPNNNLSEASDTSQETINDNSFLEEISILYSMEKNKLINDKYTLAVSELDRISDISFNVFNLSSASEQQELLLLMNHLFYLFKFDESLKIGKSSFRNYFSAVNRAYRKNPYHNSIHGCDVTQTVYLLIKTCNIESLCNLTDLDLFSVFFASAIHDVDHPGNNNNWEIAIKSSLALSYNDKAVLENYHLCKAFCIAKAQDCNVFSSFSLKDYNTSRAMIISMVLSTDMANHFSDYATLTAKNKSGELKPCAADKQFLLNQLVHSSDISNPTKPLDIYKEWVERVFQEFFSQGDKEKENGLKISYLCDRRTTNIVDAQIGFIDGIVYPLYDALSVPFPNMKIIVEFVKNNKDEFKKMKENGYMFLV